MRKYLGLLVYAVSPHYAADFLPSSESKCCVLHRSSVLRHSTNRISRDQIRPVSVVEPDRLVNLSERRIEQITEEFDTILISDILLYC